jgi:hypothetical protein
LIVDEANSTGNKQNGLSFACTRLEHAQQLLKPKQRQALFTKNKVSAVSFCTVCTVLLPFPFLAFILQPPMQPGNKKQANKKFLDDDAPT